MSEREVALEVAAFLDSAEVRALPAEARAAARRVAEAFLQTCYGELGVKPRLLDGEHVTAALAGGVPGRLRPKDPAAEHLPALLGALLDHLEATQVVPQAFEMRRALDEALPALQELVRSGGNAALARAGDAKPFVHGAEKLGRNDPCSCGSGKKYKKCHGKGT